MAKHPKRKKVPDHVRVIVRRYVTCDEGDVALEKALVVDVTPGMDWQQIMPQLATAPEMLADFPGTNVRMMTLKEINAYEDKHSS